MPLSLPARVERRRCRCVPASRASGPYSRARPCRPVAAARQRGEVRPQARQARLCSTSPADREAAVVDGARRRRPASSASAVLQATGSGAVQVARATGATSAASAARAVAGSSGAIVDDGVARHQVAGRPACRPPRPPAGAARRRSACRRAARRCLSSTLDEICVSHAGSRRRRCAGWSIQSSSTQRRRHARRTASLGAGVGIARAPAAARRVRTGTSASTSCVLPLLADQADRQHAFARQAFGARAPALARTSSQRFRRRRRRRAGGLPGSSVPARRARTVPRPRRPASASSNDTPQAAAEEIARRLAQEAGQFGQLQAEVRLQLERRQRGCLRRRRSPRVRGAPFAAHR